MDEPGFSGLKVLIEFLLAVGVATWRIIQMTLSASKNMLPQQGMFLGMFLVCESLSSPRKMRRVESKPYLGSWFPRGSRGCTRPLPLCLIFTKTNSAIP